MTLVRRLGLVLLGLVLTLFGLAFFTPMCESSIAHVFGALLGGVGGAIIGVRRRLHRVRWLTTGGGILLALLANAIDYVTDDTCAGAFYAIGAGAFAGFGIGLMVDAVRSSVRRAEAAPPPEQR